MLKGSEAKNCTSYTKCIKYIERESLGQLVRQSWIFSCYIEAGALLQPLSALDDAVVVAVWGEITMTKYGSIGELGMKRLEERLERSLLSRCSGVLRMPVAVEASDIDHTDGVLVEAADVCPYLLNGAASMDASVEIDNEMITDAAPTTSLVHTVDVRHAHILALTRSGAMHGDVIDFAIHDVK